MKQCIYCGSQNDEQNVRCRICGHEFKSSASGEFLVRCVCGQVYHAKPEQAGKQILCSCRAILNVGKPAMIAATGCASATNTVFTLITLPCLQYSTFSISNVNHTNIYLSWYGSNSLQFTTNLLSTPWVTITNGSPTGTNSNYFYFITNIVTPIDPNTGLGIPGFFRLVTTNY